MCSRCCQWCNFTRLRRALEAGPPLVKEGGAHARRGECRMAGVALLRIAHPSPRPHSRGREGGSGWEKSGRHHVQVEGEQSAPGDGSAIAREPLRLVLLERRGEESCEKKKVVDEGMLCSVDFLGLPPHGLAWHGKQALAGRYIVRVWSMARVEARKEGMYTNKRHDERGAGAQSSELGHVHAHGNSRSRREEPKVGEKVLVGHVREEQGVLQRIQQEVSIYLLQDAERGQWRWVSGLGMAAPRPQAACWHPPPASARTGRPPQTRTCSRRTRPPPCGRRTGCPGSTLCPGWSCV